jgi:N-glycosylase/DNA lyase
VRFYRTKANHLINALAMWPEIRGHLPVQPTPESIQEARDWLVENVPGMGKKAAGHFLRNVGVFCDDYGAPIIDVHIRKALAAFQLPHGKYEEAEKSFLELARNYGAQPMLLDAALWCLYAGVKSLEDTDFANFEEK